MYKSQLNTVIDLYTTKIKNNACFFDYSIFSLKHKQYALFIVLWGILFLKSELKAQTATSWIKTLASANASSGSYSLVSTDALGHIYLYGSIRGTVDVDLGAQTQTMTSVGNQDIFFAKYTSDGSLLWSKRIGSNQDDVAASLMIDALGNIIVVGQYRGTVDFNPGAAVFNLTSNGNNDIFILKTDSSGNFIWAKSFGGQYSEGVMAKLDPFDNIILVGSFFDTMDVDPGPGQFLLNYTGTGWQELDPYFIKLDSSGQFIHAFSFGSKETDQASAFDIDSSGNFYIAGYFRDTIDFDPGPNVFNLVPLVRDELFIAKYSPTGQFIWAGAMHGGDSIASDFITDLKIDLNGDLWITGEIKGPVDMDMGPGVLMANCPLGNKHAFVTKYNNNGQVIVSRVFKGRASTGLCLLVDYQNRVYIGGTFRDSTDFNDGPNDFVIQNNTLVYADFLVSLNQNGDFLWALGNSQYISGYGTADIRKMDIDPQGNILTSGLYSGTIDLDPGGGIVNIPSPTQWWDCFLRKFIYYPTTLPNIEKCQHNIIYPCPANDKIWISSSEKTNIRILDLHGRTLFRGILNSPFPSQLDISQFADGHYFVFLNDEVHRLQILH